MALLAAIILNSQPSALPRAGAASAGGVLQLRALGGGGVTVGRLILRGGEGEEVGGENKPSGPRIVRYTSADRPWGQPCEEEIYDNADMTSVCQHVATEQNGKAYGHCMECEVMAFLQVGIDPVRSSLLFFSTVCSHRIAFVPEWRWFLRHSVASRRPKGMSFATLHGQ